MLHGMLLFCKVSNLSSKVPKIVGSQKLDSTRRSPEENDAVDVVVAIVEAYDIESSYVLVTCSNGKK